MQRSDHHATTTTLRHARALFEELNYTLIDGSPESGCSCEVTGRQSLREVVLVPRLRHCLRALNPDLPETVLEKAIAELTRDRGLSEITRANQEISTLLKDGLLVMLQSDESAALAQEREKRVRVIDWETPARNDFTLVSNFQVSGSLGQRSLDLVAFLNGLPVVILSIEESELAHIHARIEREIKPELPALFWYNAFLVVANAFTCRMGSFTTPWEHFFQWKRVQSETEQESTTLETLVRGTCEPTRLLDIIENFTLFDTRDGLKKLVARNHQYLGVNNAVATVLNREAMPEEQRASKLGVFWHTQGSGKSYSMVFFVLKVLRKISNAYTFLIVTDRLDLDEQIYQTFHDVGVLMEPDQVVHARDSEHLKQLLREPHFVLFTLIQKFSVEKPGMDYEQLSENTRIIVISDEAHRTQDKTLAKNMRFALPRAAFIGFTGTPLIRGEEEQTREIFGDYVSKYDFRRAIRDGVTVPLRYENHTPELKFTGEKQFDSNMQQLLANPRLSPQQQQRISELATHPERLLTNAERLNLVARDIIEHFMGRGYRGKAMIVSHDKITARRIHNRVQDAWKRYQDDLRAHLTQEQDAESRQKLNDDLLYMEQTEMVVVISSAKDDEQHFDDFSRESGESVEIERQQNAAWAKRFKEVSDPLRLAFVCDMWSTGFDVPCLSTMYLNKRLRNHTLMQTVARANRVYGEKEAGIIIDYAGNIHELEEVLKTYAPAETADLEGGELPIGPKSELVQRLREKLGNIGVYCMQMGIDMPSLLTHLPTEPDRQRQKLLLEPAIDTLLASDEIKLNYLLLANEVGRFYRAILPDAAEHEFTLPVHLHTLLKEGLYAAMRQPPPRDLLNSANRLVSTALTVERQEERLTLTTREAPGQFEVTQLDLSKLKADLRSGPRRLKAEQLRTDLLARIKRLIQENGSRVTYLERLNKAIDTYNEGSANLAVYLPLVDTSARITTLPTSREALQEEQGHLLDAYDDELYAIASDLEQEEQRHIVEELSKEELAIFDIITSGFALPEPEHTRVKQVARALLTALAPKFVLDWSTRDQARSRVQITIDDELEALQDIYDSKTRQQQCADILLHVRMHYKDGGRYSVAG